MYNLSNDQLNRLMLKYTVIFKKNLQLAKTLKGKSKDNNLYRLLLCILLPSFTFVFNFSNRSKEENVKLRRTTHLFDKPGFS